MRAWLTRIRLELEDVLFYASFFALAFLFGCLTYSFAYSRGVSDGYASGYMNGRDGVYIEKMSEELERGYTDSLVEMAKEFGVDAVSAIEKWPGDSAYERETVTGYNYIRIYGAVTNSQIETIENQLSQMPSKLLKDFEENGWTLILTTDDLTLNYAGEEDYSASGVTKTYDKTITVNTRFRSTPNTLAHEFGHFLDHQLDRVSSGEKWLRCYESEWQGLYVLSRRFHSIGTASEYFAESFSWYIERSDELKEKCPMSYEFIDKIIKSY